MSDPRGEPVFTLTIHVFADGSTRSVSFQSVDEFWQVRRAMIAAYNQLAADISNGPETCPFSPRNTGKQKAAS